MREMTPLEMYYNKFNEDKRLNTRHGRVEFITSMKYIHKYLLGRENAKILDVGAGTGRYCLTLAAEGYDVMAVEPVQHNLGLIKKKASDMEFAEGTLAAYKGNALKLKRFDDKTFDMVLLFGPMYHLGEFGDRVQALSEAKRVLKDGGVILAAYIMNEYAVISHAFREKQISRCMEEGRLTGDFHCVPKADDLYYFVRLEDMDEFNKAAGLTRIQVISSDGAANYMRPVLNALTEDEFERFVEYHLSTCERMDLMGAGGHTVDILRKAD